MEDKVAAPMLRIPAMLMPSYNNVMATEDGKQAPKRVRVFCGVCEKIRYYSIHRGVTRIGGVIACEACRHFYQKFKRQPCILTCTEGGGCLDLNDNSRNRCRACWIGHILSRCPVPPEMYHNLISHLPKPIQERMPPEAQVAANIPENRKGSLGLEVSRNGVWEDVTVAVDLEADPNGDSSAEASGNEPQRSLIQSQVSWA
ncbi:retinoic acid receptor RXR-gamma-like isoform X1 [Macrobrachium nipponense]|uniref:retinoic acid receptor RXR-gamma-like isoform X1 n=1 Tax=Macrobrachium nipponense TaxID=159736 RepID=UPI0030C87772